MPGLLVDVIYNVFKPLSAYIQAHLEEVLLGDGVPLPPRTSGYGNLDVGPVRPPFAPRGASASPEYAPSLYRDYRSSSGSVHHCHSAAYHEYRL